MLNFCGVFYIFKKIHEYDIYMRMWDFSSATLFAVEEDSFDIFKGHTSDFSDMFFFF